MKEPPDNKEPAQVMEPERAGGTSMSGLGQGNRFIDGQAVYADISCFGQRAKVALKRFLVTGYCWNLIPHWVVTAAFRTLQLGVL